MQEQEAAERAKDRDYREWLAGSDGPDAPPADTKPKEEPLVGIPGKTYPYPLEEDVDPNARFEEFRDLRDMLLNHARTLAADLKPADPDINLRTLALARLLDRVQQLERMLPDLNPVRVIRFRVRLLTALCTMCSPGKASSKTRRSSVRKTTHDYRGRR